MQWFSWFRRRGGSGTQAGEFLWKESRNRGEQLPYLMPDSPDETNRLDFQHYLIRYVMQSNYVAPLSNPRGILDVGCGTGRWAQEMAMAFPQAKVFGLDIRENNARPTESLPNYRFIKGNVLEELPFPDMTFDFVHQRFLHVAIPVNKWQHVIEELKRVTRVGGWIEMIESDQVIQRGGPAMSQMAEWGLQLSKSQGIDARISIHLPDMLRAAGLANIQNYRIDFPLGNWAGRLGNMIAVDMASYNRLIMPKMIKLLKLDPALVQRTSEAMKREWETNQCFFSIYVMCAQRI